MTLSDVMIANSVQNEKSNKVHNRSSKKNLEVGAMGSEHPLLTGYNPGYIPLALFVIFGKTKKNRRQKVDNLWSDNKYERRQSAFDPMKVEYFC